MGKKSGGLKKSGGSKKKGGGSHSLSYNYDYRLPKEREGSQPNLLTLTDGSCGNGVCDSDEDCHSCPSDCISHFPSCGNGICEEGENCEECPQDCNGELSDEVQGLYCCYGGLEKPEELEHAVSCSDRRCDSSHDKCSYQPTSYCCGDGVCEGKETLGNCAVDSCTCGNGVCDSGEDVDSCPMDCTRNRDFTCQTHEDAEHCPEDCGNGEEGSND